jgi:putative nucleotidyltransferase with HDIG domain
MSSVLVVNPDSDQCKALAESISSRGQHVEAAGSIEEALLHLAREGHDQIVSVRNLPDGSGELLAQQVAEVSPRTRVTLVTNFAEVRTASDILRFDFADYIVDVDDVAGLITGASRGPGPSQRSVVECFLSTVEAVVGLVELSDPLTAGNAASSKRLADGIAREMGLPEERRQEVILAALLHDIGNFTIPTGTLDKEGPLEAAEEEAVRQHTLRGVQLVEHIDFPWKIKPIILSHHERYDGTGYPEGRKGRAIPVGARIIAVVDSYLSMTTRRPHRDTLNHDEAMREIHTKVGSQFDPEVVEAFVAFVQRRKKFAGDLFQVKVLVVGQGEDDLSRMKLQFLREDFVVLTASDLSTASEIAEAEDVRFVLMDITNRWDDALGLLDGLQSRLEHSRTDVFFFDSEDSRERRVTALENGAEEVFPEDVSPSEVASRIRRILRKEQAVRKKATLAGELGGIEGELSEMSLPEVVQMLSMGQKTARISVKARGLQGVLFLQNGRLTHVEGGGGEGKEAFEKLLSLTNGHFRISHGVTTEIRTIDRDAVAALLDALKTLDETARSKPESQSHA